MYRQLQNGLISATLGVVLCYTQHKAGPLKWLKDVLQESDAL